jgi:hypothetical protein
MVHDFTFGREREVQQVEDWLESPAQNTLLLAGEYGTGKTHFLRFVAEHALQAGYAVAEVQIDPNEAPFHRPKRIYGHLVHTLTYRDPNGRESRSFRDLLEATFIKDALADHRYFARVRARGSERAIWDWIEARESTIRPQNPWDQSIQGLPGLYDYSSAANIYCYLLSGLGWAAQFVLGLRGLFLVFDEAESIELSYGYQEARGWNFLKALLRTASSEEALLGSPQSTQLEYCLRARHVPFLYKPASGLKLLLAFTRIESATLPVLSLQPLQGQEWQTIFEHIVKLYLEAYGSDAIGSGKVQDIFARVAGKCERTRGLVKTCVETLDLIRFHPSEPLAELLR